MKSPFKHGDRVAMNKTIGTLQEGTKGTIIPDTQRDLPPHLEYAHTVKWDTPYRGYDERLIEAQHVHHEHLNQIFAPVMAAEPETEFKVGDIVECIESDWNNDRGIKQGTKGVVVGVTDGGILRVKFDQAEPPEEYVLTFPKRVKLVLRPRFKVGDVVALVSNPSERFGVITRTRETLSAATGDAVHWVRNRNSTHETLVEEHYLLPFPNDTPKVAEAPAEPHVVTVGLRKTNDIGFDETTYDGSLSKSVKWVDAVFAQPSKNHRVQYVKMLRSGYSKGVADGKSIDAALEKKVADKDREIAGLKARIDNQAHTIKDYYERFLEKDAEIATLKTRTGDYQKYAANIGKDPTLGTEKVKRLQARIDEVENQLCIERSAWNVQHRADKATIRALKRRLNRLHHTLQRVRWISTNMLDGPPSRAEREMLNGRG